MKKLFAAALILVVLSTFSYGQAGVGFNLGTEYGTGLLAQFGTQKVKLEIGGGVTPILVIWQITVIGSGYGGDETYTKFYLSGTFGAKLNIALNKEEKGRLGLKLGANYDTIMKTGIGIGVDYNISGKPKKPIVISGGFTYYADAYDELFDRLVEDEGEDFTKDDVSASLIGFRPFVSVTLFF
ncbi:hypothetical protein JW835_15220 [bacterium]|nr:hypothetical protein [bacterium]